VQNDFFEKRAANEHHQPVAVKRDTFAGRGHVIKIFNTVTEPTPNRFEAIQKKAHDFDALKFAGFFQRFGKACVDVIAFDAEIILCRARLFLAPVATETVEHELNHVTLAVMRRRRVGKDKQLHKFTLQICARI
jgi:hypothetical protein